MSDARLDDDVTVSMDLSEEVVPVKYIHPIKDDDLVCGGVLDAGHFVLAVDF